MDKKIALVVLIAALTLSICFTAAASASERPYFFSDIQHIGKLQQLTATAPVIIGASLHGNAVPPLEQPTRLEIYDYIKDNPGIHFRGVCDGLGLPVGVVQYHLGVLEHAGLIKSVADGQNKRYFEINAYKATDVKMVSLMRHDTTAKILTILAQNNSVLHRDIACSLGISSQALTWQMNQLRGTGLISAEKEGVNVRYCLNYENTRNIILKFFELSK